MKPAKWGNAAVYSEKWLNLCLCCTRPDCDPDSKSCPIRIAFRAHLEPARAVWLVLENKTPFALKDFVNTNAIVLRTNEERAQ